MLRGNNQNRSNAMGGAAVDSTCGKYDRKRSSWHAKRLSMRGGLCAT